MKSSHKPTNSFDNLLSKAKNFCAYQERAHQEVKEKLLSLGATRKEADEIIIVLIEENFLNEQRFAIVFAGGKFRTKGWGKIKITYELKIKSVSTQCITKALSEIDADDYQMTLEQSAYNKWNTLDASESHNSRKAKTAKYLQQKGFEFELIMQAINKLSR